MSMTVGAVDFEGGGRRYLIFNNTVDEAQRQLFETEEAAWKAILGGVEFYFQAEAASPTEVRVIVTSDLYLKASPNLCFESKASLKHLWLTGPTSWIEAEKSRNTHQAYF
ncbi:hypothetical protein QMA79_18745 [Pseudomonas aeruginosa]|uniref:hypothetical protein n=1 Tax=Pseudomonas aeruginosa TaxID=287 RepID=UPI0024AD96DA|nr:hypothetical protein [Pseudomonas aeruginosa]MDI6671854.1 hypothetical protein [Pseudomonas aeruginosa]